MKKQSVVTYFSEMQHKNDLFNLFMKLTDRTE